MAIAGLLVASIYTAGCGAQVARSDVQGPAASPTSASTQKNWTCTSALPPGSDANRAQVVQSRRIRLGGGWVEAAALAGKGCVTVYVAQASSQGWHAHRVTGAASGGNGVSSLQLATSGPRDIWLLAQGLPGAGQAPAFLFRSRDGGKTWLPEPAGQGGALPHANVQLRMRFSSSRDGWITDLNTFYGPPRVEVYRTTDGGRSWSLTTFSVPARYATQLGNGVALPPVFQNALEGTLKIRSALNGHVTTLVYGTNDGGETWLLEAESTPANGG
jgi:hypothetical protein